MQLKDIKALKKPRTERDIELSKNDGEVIVDDYAGSNVDDAYQAGLEDGEISGWNAAFTKIAEILYLNKERPF